MQFFARCSAAFGQNDFRTTEKPNVAVQLLQRRIPKTAAQLPFSLVACCWELGNIYHHHPESKKRKSSEASSGSIHPYGRYENAVKTGVGFRGVGFRTCVHTSWIEGGAGYYRGVAKWRRMRGPPLEARQGCLNRGVPSEPEKFPKGPKIGHLRKSLLRP